MSGRSLTAESKTYLAGKKAITYNLLKMAFPTPLFYTDAPYNIDYNGDTYLSNGTIREFPEIPETTEAQPNTVSIPFSGVEVVAHAITLLSYKNVEVTIYRKIMSTTQQVIKIYTGYIDKYDSVENVRRGTSDITWKVVNHWGNLAKTKGRILNDEYQQSIHVGDDGLEFIGVTDGVTDWWGKKSYKKMSLSKEKPSALLGTKVEQHIANPWLWLTTYDWYYDWDAATLSNERLPVAYGDTPPREGTPVFRGLSGTNNEFLWVVYALCEGETDSSTQITIEGEDITSANLSGNVAHWFHSGTITQAVDSALAAAFVGVWTSSHQLKGICYEVLRYTYDPDLFNGEPIPEFRIKAKKVYDPRSTLTVWSNNNVLIMADYLSSDLYGNSIPYALIGDINASADICDTLVQDYAGGALIPRYQFNGVLDTNKKVSDNVKAIRLSMFADIPWVNGVYRIRLEAELKTPVYNFASDTIKGSVKVSDASTSSYSNKLIYKYTSVEEGYVSSSVVEESATYLAEDGNVILEKTISNPFETNVYRARNLARTALKRSREQISIRVEAANADALQIEPSDIVTVTLDAKSWGAKQFKVREMKVNKQNEINLTLIEYEPTVYDWSVGTFWAVPNAPAMQSPFFVAPVAVLTLDSGSANLILGDDGTIVSRIYGDFIKATDAYVEKYEVHAKKSTELNYIIRETLNAKDESEFYISPVEDGATYNVRMYAVNSLGKRSAPYDLDHLVVGKDQLPVAPTSIGIGSVDENVVNLFWGTSPDLDFAAMEVWTNTVNDRTTATLRVTQPGTTFNHSTSVPTYYWVRAVDTSGLKSTYFPVSPTGGLLGTPDGTTSTTVWADITGDGKPDDYASASAINLLSDGTYVKQAGGESHWTTGVALFSYLGEAASASAKITATGGVLDSPALAYIPANQGDVFYISCRVWVSTDFNGTFQFGTNTFNKDKTDLASWPSVSWLHSSVTKGAWITVTGSITVAASGAEYTRPRMSVRSDATAGYVIWSSSFFSASELHSTVGAVWSSNITGQPTDSELLNSLQDWLDVSGDGIPDSYFERGIVIHNWFNANHNWITSQNTSFSTGLILTASTATGALASMQFLNIAKWSWDAGRFFSVSFTVTNASNHSTSVHSTLLIGGLGSTMSLGIAFIRSGSTLVPYGYKNINGTVTLTLISGVTFTDSDNIRAEAWISPAGFRTTMYAFYKNGVRYFAQDFQLAFLTGTLAASTVPNFLTNASVGGPFSITISDYYFQQLEA